MFSPTTFSGLESLIDGSIGVGPLAAGVAAGIALALWRISGSLANPFGLRGSRSLMNFSSQGDLKCICATQYGEGGMPDRRQVCRSCGCKVVAPNPELLEKEISHRQIVKMTRTLRRATVRASHLELPPLVTTIEALEQYLKSSPVKHQRKSYGRPAAVKQPQAY